MNGRPIKEEWWSTHLRQRIHLGLVTFSFYIYTFGYFTRASRSYSVTDLHDLLILSPEVFECRKTKGAKTLRTLNLQTGTNITYLRSMNYYLTAKGGQKSKKKEPKNIPVSK